MSDPNLLAPAAQATRAAVRKQVLDLLGQAQTPVADDDDLLGHGLASLHIMQLLNRWRRSGAALTYAQLIECPTIAGWSALLAPSGSLQQSVCLSEERR